ncbi:hypothetical protein AB0D62_37575 [Streptomyces massasporeus]|uniref:hypothetical protein n=1 Tax=Streptomyces massasporeus TaxID=67324 RepID=UPI0033C0E9CA
MIIHDGIPSDSPGPAGRQPSAELVPVRRYHVKHLPEQAWPGFTEVLSTPGSPDLENSRSDLGEKVASLFLTTAAQPSPEPEELDIDCVLVQEVDGQLRTWLFQAKWAHGTERARARLGIFAALNARKAILESKTVDGWKPAVAEFAATWLGIPRPDERWLEAVSTALLGNWVDLLDEHLLDEAGGLGLKQLKQESSAVHRQLQPLWRRKAAAGRLLSLDHPVAGGGTLVDLLADRAAPQERSTLWEPESPGAAAVFAQLTPREQQIARVWAQSGRTSWAETADLAGVSAADAEGVRRKLRRLGHRHKQRMASARANCGRSVAGSCGSWACTSSARSWPSTSETSPLR